MKVESTVRQDQIVEAAIRRFSHFGVSKTTLSEIADDLAVSKQSLAYYFPDKRSLVQAVEEKITNDYIESLRSGIILSSSVEQALLKLTEIKAAFFEKYYMLALQAEHIANISGNEVQNWKEKIRERELRLMIPLFESGIQKGELKNMDATATAELFLDTMYAFSRCIKDRGILPDAAAFSVILNKQKEVISLFCKGLKN